MIDINVYFKIADLFSYRYDPAVLSLIAERPSRFRELVTRLEGHVGGHVDDNAVGRSLKRLARLKHIRKMNVHVGGRALPAYTITSDGWNCLHVYDAFIRTYRELRRNGDRPGPDSDGA